MKRGYWMLPTLNGIHNALRGTEWEVWAKLPDRDDRYIHTPEGVKQTEHGALLINVGEYSPKEQKYINEEWVIPTFIYAKHPCADCHYPPHMCCLQPASFRDPEDYTYGGHLSEEAETDEEIMETDEYGDELDKLNSPPALAVWTEIVV